MSAETQKLELISWIAGLDDPAELQRVYEQFKKALKPGPRRRKSVDVSQEADTDEALRNLEKITDAYAASEEPDLNPAQIFAERLITYERTIDFN